MRQRPDRRITYLSAHRHLPDEARMIEDFLEFCRSLDALVCSQICLATQIDWHHRRDAVRVSQFVRTRDVEALNRFALITLLECQSSVNRRQMEDANESALGKPFVQVVGDFLPLGRITRERQCQRRCALHVRVAR